MRQTNEVDIPVANGYVYTLIEKAQSYWAVDEPLPLDLFAELMSAGIDVEALEAKYKHF